MKRLFLLLAIAIAGFAADVTGTWKATAEAPNGGTMERTFVFKVDGAKLTGETTSSMLGKSTITNGKIEGDNLSFTITVKFQDNEMTLNYKGKVNGDQIDFTVENPNGGPTLQWHAKKVS